MHLLNTKSMQLESYGNPPNKYAILSHTWGEQEVLYEDIKSKDRGRSKRGFKKIENCCKLALSEGYELVWIDTCCIDKSSSAELSEAINSMFGWYQNSDKCYAFLEDFSPTEAPAAELIYNDWKYCKYFTRGWTLQELLAPYELHFYDKNWRYFKSKRDMADELSAELGIASKALKQAYIPLNREYSIATRMSWASKRDTSRPEDIAYCLLGIFGVNIPLLYGEGATKAFFRLQEEIIRISDDETIFTWVDPKYGDKPQVDGVFPGVTGVLARSPASFAQASKIVPSQRDNVPFFMTNMGLSISLPLFPENYVPGSINWHAGQKVWLFQYAVLNCHYYDDFRGPLCLELWPMGKESNHFSRTQREPFRIKSSLVAKAVTRPIFISRFGSYSVGSDWLGAYNYSQFWIRAKMAHKHLENQPFSVQGFPSEFWNCESAVLSKPTDTPPSGAALVTFGEKSNQPLQFAVLFQYPTGSHHKLQPMIMLLPHSEFDENHHSIDHYAGHLTEKSVVTSSLQLSKDVKVSATIKAEVAMGKSINIVELHFSRWNNRITKEFTKQIWQRTS